MSVDSLQAKKSRFLFVRWPLYTFIINPAFNFARLLPRSAKLFLLLALSWIHLCVLD
jgi:hypothetical protein